MLYDMLATLKMSDKHEQEWSTKQAEDVWFLVVSPSITLPLVCGKRKPQEEGSLEYIESLDVMIPSVVP